MLSQLEALPEIELHFEHPDGGANVQIWRVKGRNLMEKVNKGGCRGDCVEGLTRSSTASRWRGAFLARLAYRTQFVL